MTEDVPFYLMPVAAVFGLYSLFGGVRILYLLYANLAHKKGSIPPSVALVSRPFAMLLGSVVASVLIYGKIVAHVEYAMAQSEYALFDPYDILSVKESADTGTIKHAYRELSKQHHPDKGGDEVRFQQINTAYRALIDKEGSRNYQLYGHPDGPVKSQSFSLALPGWLLHPQGNVAVVLVLLYLGMFGALIYFVIRWATQTEASASKKALDTSVAATDSAYIASKINPTSTPLDVLFCIATTPENIALTQSQLDKADTMRAEKLAKRTKLSKKKKKTMSFDDLGDAGWDEGDDADEDAKKAAEKAKKEEEIRAEQRKQLAEASGDIPMEGIDDGVLGQQWVERILEKSGFWPPKDMASIKHLTFKNEKTGAVVGPLDHPAIRRNLVIIVGRLNSHLLNSHPELLEATSKGLVDQTYFKFNMENRQRTGLLLEACLRVAMSMQSYRLAKTIIETVAMFKIGVNDPHSEASLNRFNTMMKKMYGPNGLPGLKLSNMKVETPGEDEIATGDVSTIMLDLERTHAEVFVRVKSAQWQKQGIPLQVALQTYREGWWILVRAKKLDGDDDGPMPLEIPSNPLTKMLSEADKKKFEQETAENRLLTAWPMIVQNMAQKTGRIKVQFKAPAKPGKYRFYIDIKSQEFLGADQSFELEADILDAEEVKRKAAEEEDNNNDDDKKAEENDEEGKKDK